MIDLDVDSASIESRAAGNLASSSHPDHLAYCMYTSGSSGQPKGLCIPHRSIPGFLMDVSYAEFDHRTVWLQYSSVSWDALTLELWPALLRGGRCVLYGAVEPSPMELGRHIARHGINTLWLTSAFFNVLIDEDVGYLGNVKQLLIGGDQVSRAHVAKLTQERPDIRVVNGYGPSECTVFSTCHPIPASFSADGSSVPIGKPIGDRRVYLLDRRMRPVPVGVAGELHVAGDALARGYLRNPSLTATKFVPNPFGAAGSRLYKTGDLARFLPDGEIEFLGRIDHQVKIRGFRIELGDIEHALLRCESVRAACVLVWGETAQDKRLVAYLSGEEGALPQVASVRAQLQAMLPQYMVPQEFMVLDSLPLTGNGKVDRKALPMPGARESDLPRVAPATPTEVLLADLWTALLKVEKIGRHDNFFHLGGHSLLATQFVSRLRQQCGIELPLLALFEAPTVESLALRLAAYKRRPHDVERRITTVLRDRPLPLSFAQERMWLLDQLGPGGSAFNIPFALALRGELNETAIEQALSEIVRRHESLRTTFRAIAGSPFQVVEPASKLGFAVIDLSHFPPAQRMAHARQAIADDATAPFDLATGPLLRAGLVRLAPDDHILSLTVHHVVYDGWSQGVLLRELEVLYNGYVHDRPSALPPLAVQYADFAQWQRLELVGDALEKQTAYWHRELSGAPALLEFPTDRHRPAVQGREGASVDFEIDPDISKGLSTLGNETGSTSFIVLLAAFKVLLSRYCGQDDISIGTVIAGRNRDEIEPLIGFFTNTLVLRTRLSQEGSFRDLLLQVRRTTLCAYENQDVPLEYLLNALRVARDPAYSPLFQVRFILQNAPTHTISLDGLETHPLADVKATSVYDMTLYMHHDASGLLHGSLEYSTALFDAATIEGVVQSFGNLLAAIVHHPDDAIDLLPLTSATDETEMADWSTAR